MGKLLAVVAAIALAGSAMAAEQGLVGWYTFAEGSGLVAADQSGSGNPGTITGAKFVKTGKGYALEFNGTGDWVDLGSKGSFNLTEQLTLETWIWPDPKGQAAEIFFMGKAFPSFGLTYFGEREKVYFYVNHPNYTGASVPAGQWSHVVATFGNKTLTLYVNGEPAGTTATDVTKINSGGNLALGTHSSSPDGAPTPATQFFKGKLANVRVYSRALTTAEVKEHYASTKANVQP